MEMDNGMHHDVNSLESNDTCDQTKMDENNRKRRQRTVNSECDDNAIDEEKLRQLIQNSIRAEVRPLIKKIDALQGEIAESKNEIVNLKQIINKMTKENSILQKSNNNVQIDSGNIASGSYANVVQKKKAE